MNTVKDVIESGEMTSDLLVKCPAFVIAKSSHEPTQIIQNHSHLGLR